MVLVVQGLLLQVARILDKLVEIIQAGLLEGLLVWRHVQIARIVVLLAVSIQVGLQATSLGIILLIRLLSVNVIPLARLVVLAAVE